mmetsp:Transcript_3863/g.6443  ORF Transcript_3863/g.6443 Transcript_3863/m.6443 type:complete len:259 (-) Transcript_3863:363-1139(-)
MRPPRQRPCGDGRRGWLTIGCKTQHLRGMECAGDGGREESLLLAIVLLRLRTVLLHKLGKKFVFLASPVLEEEVDVLELVRVVVLVKALKTIARVHLTSFLGILHKDTVHRGLRVILNVVLAADELEHLTDAEVRGHRVLHNVALDHLDRGKDGRTLAVALDLLKVGLEEGGAKLNGGIKLHNTERGVVTLETSKGLVTNKEVEQEVRELLGRGESLGGHAHEQPGTIGRLRLWVGVNVLAKLHVDLVAHLRVLEALD